MTAEEILVANGWKFSKACTSCGGNKKDYVHPDKPNKRVQLLNNSQYFYVFEGAFCTKADYTTNLEKVITTL